MSENQPSSAPAIGSAAVPEFVQHTELPPNRFSDAVDTALKSLGLLFSLLWLPVVGVILYSVVGRYAFGQGSVMLEELSWHLAGAAWLVGLSYTLVSDHHVRVDVLHERLSLGAKAWIELLGILFLLLPFLVIVVDGTTDYFLSSYQQNERSQAPAGLPARWLLKGIMALAFILLMAGAISRLSKCTTQLFGWPRSTRKPVNGS